MSVYTSFAVVGAGGIGLPVVKELLARNASVLVITRPSSSSKDIPAGAQLATIDYNDVIAVAAALREHKVQVVLSTLGAGLTTQIALANAAKEAGVQLFAPSEYGMPTKGHTQGMVGEKAKLGEHLKLIDLPSARFYVGLFIEYIPWVTGLDESGKFYIVGQGNTPASYTATSDIVGFVAHVLTTLPPPKLADSTFRIQGVRATLLEIAARYGAKVQVVHVDAIPSEIPDNAFKTALQKALEQGYVSTGWDMESGQEIEGGAGSSNELWEGHEWKGLKDVHGI